MTQSLLTDEDLFQPIPFTVQRYEEVMEILNKTLSELHHHANRMDISDEEREQFQVHEQILWRHKVRYQITFNSTLPQQRYQWMDEEQAQQPYIAYGTSTDMVLLSPFLSTEVTDQVPEMTVDSFGTSASNLCILEEPPQKPEPESPTRCNLISPPLPQSDTDNPDGIQRFLSKESLQNLVKQVDPSTQLTEQVLLKVADEFIESITIFACQLAKHRGSNTLHVKDLQLHLERNWNIWIPGFNVDPALRNPGTKFNPPKR